MPFEELIHNQSGDWKLPNEFEIEKLMLDNQFKWRF